MQTTRHETTAAAEVTGALAAVRAATDRLLAVVAAAEPDAVGMATAGSVLASTDRLAAVVVQVLSLVTHRGVIADEGLSIGAWLRTFADRTIADERMLTATVDRLADMPSVRAWFFAGELSWPVVRGIVAVTRNLTREQRRWVDATLAGDGDRVGGLDAEQVVAAVAALADRARPDLHRDRERRGELHEFVRLQEGLDGSITGQFQFGAEHADVFRRAITTTLNPNDTRPERGHNHDHEHTADGDAKATDDPPADAAEADTAPADTATAAHPSHDDHADTTTDDADTNHPTDAVDAVDGDDLTGYDRWRRGREHRNAKALIALCRQRLGLRGGSAPSPAKPSLLILADITALTDTDAGGHTAQLLAQSTRGPVELTPAALQRLACDATWRIVFTDGATILGATAAHPKVSATLRAALVARDGRCRFPACHQPAELCDNHHIITVADGGPTVLDNLLLLCSAHHHAVHDSNWTTRLHPDGTTTFTRRGVTITSLPRAEQRLRPTQPPPPGRPHRHRSRCGPDDLDHADIAHSDDPDPPPIHLPF